MKIRAPSRESWSSLDIISVCGSIPIEIPILWPRADMVGPRPRLLLTLPLNTTAWYIGLLHVDGWQFFCMTETIPFYTVLMSTPRVRNCLRRALETVYKHNNYFFVYLRTLPLVHVIWRRISKLWRISKEVLCTLSRYLLVGPELNQETPRRDSRCHGYDMNHASPECNSETLSLIPVALSASTVKVSLNSPQINYYPPTHVSVCQVVQFIKFYNKSRVRTSVTMRYGMLLLLLLLMLSSGQQVLTASWLPAWLARLTDIFMVTTEGRWPAL